MYIYDLAEFSNYSRSELLIKILCTSRKDEVQKGNFYSFKLFTKYDL